jgi:hypothetical protein
MLFLRSLAFAAFLLAAPPTALAEPPQGSSELLQRFPIKEARQAVGVDAGAFYAIDNTTIAKYDKRTGKRIARWESGKGSGAIHLDSAVVVDGKLYAAHSNYPAWPMASSIEVWDAARLKHIESHSLGFARGALTWLDRDAKGRWWGTFAQYDRIPDENPSAYGDKRDTRLVRFDADWRVAEAWVFPDALLEKFGDMSNSGGSWGPDGRLYVTGHDDPALYILEIPDFGATLKWVGTIPVEITGQGIAFDRSRPGLLYGIIRKQDGNAVTVSRLKPPPTD